MSAARAVLAVVLLAVFFGVIAASQEVDTEEAFSERTRVTAVDVVVEVRNPGKIDTDDLTVTDDGTARPVVRVAPVSDPESEPWRIVLYFDLPLATSGTVQAAIAGLAEQVVPLVALGQVEVVVADTQPRTLLPPTDDPELLNQSLSRLLLRLKSTNALNEIRRLALDGAGTDGPADEDADPPIDAVTAVRREVALVTQQQDELVIWTADQPSSGGPNLLFLVSDGFDLDPGFFYSDRVPGPNDGSWARQYLARTNADLAKSMAGYGWLIYPLTFRQLEADPENRVSEFDRERYRAMDGPYGDRTALVPFNLKGGGKKRKQRAAEGFLLLDPLAPLQILAETTGGRLVEKSTGISQELTALGNRVQLTFQASETLDGRLRSLTVSARDKEVIGPGWVRSGTPSPVAEARIRRLFDGGREAAGLDVEGRWASQSGGGSGRSLNIEVTVSEDAMDNVNEMPTMRVTLGQGTEDGEITFQHLVVNNRDYSGDKWLYSAAFRPLPNSDWVVLLVEDLASGTWGAEALEPPNG